MYVKKSTIDLYISLFSIGVVLCACYLLVTKVLVHEKEETTLKERQSLLLSGKKYIINNSTNYVNLETLYNSGYISNDIPNVCDKKNSTIEYKDKKLIINLVCNNKIEKLTIAK
ncbi:MAG TPA: hypothetical protein PLT65_00170 [Bacilli bacterium]|nr:hypothetical protein [Bacilli bacterium]